MIISPLLCQSNKFPFVCRLYQEINIVSKLSLIRALDSELTFFQWTHHCQISPGWCIGKTWIILWNCYTMELLCHFAGLMHSISSSAHYTINNSLQCCQDCNDIFQQCKTHQEVRFFFVLIIFFPTVYQHDLVFKTQTRASFSGKPASVPSAVLSYPLCFLLT